MYLIVFLSFSHFFANKNTTSSIDNIFNVLKNNNGFSLAKDFKITLGKPSMEEGKINILVES